MDSTAWPTDEWQEVSVQSYSQASDTAVFLNEEQRTFQLTWTVKNDTNTHTIDNKPTKTTCEYFSLGIRQVSLEIAPIAS